MNQGIVAASSLILTPEIYNIPLSNLRFLSPNSKCYSFDKRANGYARSEGTAVLVLKPLEQALLHNDTVRAIIRTTGSNQDERTTTLTQPSQEAQELLLRQKFTKVGLNFADTGFFEAHGTGTSVVGSYRS